MDSWNHGCGVQEVGFAVVDVAQLTGRGHEPYAAHHTRLREGIARLALDELADRAGEAVAGRSGRDALVAFASAYRDHARRHPGRYAATRLRLGPDSPAVSAGRRHAALTRAVLRGYPLDDVDTAHAVRLLGSVVHGYTDLELSGSFDPSDPPPAESWARILDATLRSWAPDDKTERSAYKVDLTTT